MRRRRGVWLYGVLALLLALVIGEYLALAWIVPRYTVHALRHAFGLEVTVSRAQLQFPLTLVLDNVRWDREWPLAGFHARRVIIKPAWWSWSRRKLWLRSMAIERLWVHATRTAKGTLRSPAPSARAGPSAPTEAPGTGWSVSVASLTLTDSTLTFLDEQIPKPFHGAIDHLSVVAGPLAWPPVEDPVALAIRGEAVSHQGYAAPLYCSGWLNPVARDLEASCQLELLPLAAFDPYYDQGRVQVRVYDAKVNSTSSWSARDNRLEGRIQLTITNLHEGDVSIRGTTVMDIKRIAGGEPATLTGEVQVSGPLSDPGQWEFELVPGNEIVQRIVKPLLDRGREIIRVRLGGETIELGIGTATKDEMSDIEAAGKEVERSLEMLAPPRPEETPAPETAPLAPAVSPAGPEITPPRAPPIAVESVPAVPKGGGESSSTPWPAVEPAPTVSKGGPEPVHTAETPAPAVAPAAPLAPAVSEPIAPPASPAPSSPATR